ncbi:MAG TPA: hypothetical protein P5239_11040, partial [Victivallales bacterium]|nr:hypothetical protein [Victivallales bacterium]
AYSNLECASFYKKKVDEILSLSYQDWEKVKETMRDEDRKISEIMQKNNLSHYAIKYNRFMGVISDYFLKSI